MLLLTLALLNQDPELDTILRRYRDAQSQSMTEEEFRQILRTTRDALDRYIAKSTDHAATARVTLAEVHIHLMDFARAVETLDAFAEKHPKDERVASARFTAAELLIQIEKDGDARGRFEAWMKDYPDDPRVFQGRMYLAILAMYAGKFDDAALALEKIRSDFRGKAQEWSAAMQLVICHHVKDDSQAARRVLEEIIERCPERSMVEAAKRLLNEYVHLGKELPSEEETDQTGEKLHLAAHRGKVVVFYFYSSGIPLAEGEIQFLKQIHKHFEGKDLAILGVATEKGRDRFDQFKTIQQIPWTVYLDGNGLQGPIARKYSVRGLPSLWVLDRKGRARFFNISGRDLRLAIDKLLQE